MPRVLYVACGGRFPGSRDPIRYRTRLGVWPGSRFDTRRRGGTHMRACAHGGTYACGRQQPEGKEAAKADATPYAVGGVVVDYCAPLCQSRLPVQHELRAPVMKRGGSDGMRGRGTGETGRTRLCPSVIHGSARRVRWSVGYGYYDRRERDVDIDK